MRPRTKGGRAAAARACQPATTRRSRGRTSRPLLSPPSWLSTTTCSPSELPLPPPGPPRIDAHPLRTALQRRAPSLPPHMSISSTASRSRLPPNFAPSSAASSQQQQHPFDRVPSSSASSSSSYGHQQQPYQQQGSYTASPAPSSSAHFSSYTPSSGGRDRMPSASSFASGAPPPPSGGPGASGIKPSAAAMGDDERRAIAHVYWEELGDFLVDFLKRGASTCFVCREGAVKAREATRAGASPATLSPTRARTVAGRRPRWLAVLLHALLPLSTRLPP